VRKYGAFLVAMVILAGGCAPADRKLPPVVTVEEYREEPITPGRYLEYLQYRSRLGAALPGAPDIQVTPQSILSNECGVCVIVSVARFYGDEASYVDVKKEVLGTHAQGTSIAAIEQWFVDRKYSHVQRYYGVRDEDTFARELKTGALIVALIYAFRDGFGPNHFVVASCVEGGKVNVVDSRIGTYSEPLEFFLSQRSLMQGQWIAVRR